MRANQYYPSHSPRQRFPHGKVFPMLTVFFRVLPRPRCDGFCCATLGVNRQNPIEVHYFARIVSESDNVMGYAVFVLA